MPKKTAEQIVIMREGGQMLAEMMRELSAMPHVGMKTREISARAVELIKQNKVDSSFLNYRGYPDVICLSVNHQAVHTPGSDYQLQDGDLLKLDFGIIHRGLHTDMACTVLVADNPDTDEHKQKRALMQITREALDAGIRACKDGNTLGHISAAIGKVIDHSEFSIVRELGGHGIGEKLHDEPWIPNFGKSGQGMRLSSGMTFALEPITAIGKWQIKDGADGFTYEMKDGSLSAHFEHTVLVTDGEPKVLTR